MDSLRETVMEKNLFQQTNVQLPLQSQQNQNLKSDRNSLIKLPLLNQINLIHQLQQQKKSEVSDVHPLQTLEQSIIHGQSQTMPLSIHNFNTNNNRMEVMNLTNSQLQTRIEKERDIKEREKQILNLQQRHLQDKDLSHALQQFEKTNRQNYQNQHLINSNNHNFYSNFQQEMLQENPDESSNNEQDASNQNLQQQMMNTQNSVSTPTNNESNKKKKQLKFPTKKPIKIDANTPFKFGNADSLSKEEVFNKKLQQYRDFNFKVNYGAYTFIQNPTQQVSYKVFIGRGNNRPLISRYFKQRWWWTIVDSDHKFEANYIWTQLKNNDFITQKLRPSQSKILQELMQNNSKENFESDSSKTKSQQSDRDGKPKKAKNRVSRSQSYNDNKPAELTNQDPSQVKMNGEQNQNSQNSLGSSTNKQNPKINRPNAIQIDKPSQQNTIQTNNTQNQNSPQKKKKESIMKPVQASDPHLKILNFSDYKVFKKYNEKYGKKDENLQLEDLSYRLQFLPKKQDKLCKILDSQIIRSHNHFEFNWHLGNKKALFYNMKQYYELIGLNPFDFIPLTFHIQKGLDDKEYKNFLKYFRLKEKEIQKQEEEDDYQKRKKLKKIRNIWIVKPGEQTNRGNGITVHDDLSEIKRILSNKEKHPNGKDKTNIVQQYLDRPFLYNKRKFDIRCYMLISSINGIVRGYWYQEGYIRTSSYEFSIQDCQDTVIHLTNDAVQKYCEDYGKYEPGNKLSLQEFQRYLDLWLPDQKLNFFTDVYPKMKSIATDTIKATYMRLDPKRRDFTFEIFGFDFMIDENFKPWLIEVNTNPDITTHTPITARVIPPMVENAFRIGLDPLFPCPTQWPAQKRHLTPDNVLETNKFELVFDEMIDGPALIAIYKDTQDYLEGILEMEEEEEMKSDEEDDKNEDPNLLEESIA